MGQCDSPLEGVEGRVIQHIGKHTPAITLPTTPPLKRGVVITRIFQLLNRSIYKIHPEIHFPTQGSLLISHTSSKESPNADKAVRGILIIGVHSL